MTPGSRVSLSNVVFTKVNVTGMVHHFGELIDIKVLIVEYGERGIRCVLWTSFDIILRKR